MSPFVGGDVKRVLRRDLSISSLPPNLPPSRRRGRRLPRMLPLAGSRRLPFFGQVSSSHKKCRLVPTWLLKSTWPGPNLRGRPATGRRKLPHLPHRKMVPTAQSKSRGNPWPPNPRVPSQRWPAGVPVADESHTPGELHLSHVVGSAVVLRTHGRRPAGAGALGVGGWSLIIMSTGIGVRCPQSWK